MTVEELRKQAYEQVRPELQELTQGLPEQDRQRILSEIGKPLDIEIPPQQELGHLVPNGKLSTAGIKCRRDQELEKQERFRRLVQEVQKKYS